MTPEVSGKRLELLKEAIPGLFRVALLTDLGSGEQNAYLPPLAAAAHALGVQLQPVEVQGPAEFEGAFLAATRGHAQALMSGQSALLAQNRARLAELALASRLPTIAGEPEFAKAGGLMDYGPNFPNLFRRAATYVDKILKGAKPADLPVEQPMTFELVINRASRDS